MSRFIVTCPKCQDKFEPAEAYNQFVKTEVEKEVFRSREKILTQEHQLKEKEKQLLTQQRELDLNISEKVAQKTLEIHELATEQATNKLAVEMKDLQSQISEKEKALAESQTVQLTLRKQAREVEEKEKRLDLEIEKKAQERAEEMKNSTLKLKDEEHRLIKLEYEKKIRDIEVQLELTRRTANQGSQQTQGEIVEDDFESQLRVKFPTDSFVPVPKGIEGADLIQTVRGASGQSVGTKIWEFKNTKSFAQEWITKLGKDQRVMGADIAILVTRVLPKDAPPISMIEGIFVVSYALAIPFAATLRRSLMELSYARAVTQGQDEKMRIIYNYLTGPSFKQKILSIVQAFEQIKDQLESEKKYYKKTWAFREKMLEQVIDSATSMYGEIEAIAGRVLPEIPSLSLLNSGMETLPGSAKNSGNDIN